MELTKLQKMAAEHVESLIADAWKKLLDVARAEKCESSDVFILCNTIKKAFLSLMDLTESLDCRFAIDFEPVLCTDTVGLVRLYLLPKEQNSPVIYNGYQMYIGSDKKHLDIINGLEIEFSRAIRELIEPVKNINASNVNFSEDNNIVDYYIEKMLMPMITIRAINDFLASVFGEDNSGIIFIQNVSDKSNQDPLHYEVLCYQPDGERERLVL